MEVVLLAVGKRHDPALADAINDYSTRLSRYFKSRWVLVPTVRASMSPAEQKKLETKLLLEQLQSNDTIVLLDERGEQWSTKQLAHQLEKWQLHGQRVVVVIGGAFGVTDELQKRASHVWSLSSLVFPHQLVRLILAEQLYRAATILRGEPYHHE